MKTIILIPSRLASTRLPNKPLKVIEGIPMIVRVLECAKKSNIGEVFVVTPDEEIGKVVKNAGGNFIITRDSHVSGTDRILEALEKIDPKRKYNRVINLQGDLPNIYPQHIEKVSNLLENNNVDIGTLISPLSKDRIEDPNIVKVALSLKKQDLIGKAIYFSRLPIPANMGQYYQHIGIYTYTRESLERFCLSPQTVLERREKLEQLRALDLGMSIFAYLIDNPPIGVDTEEDLELVRRKFSNFGKG